MTVEISLLIAIVGCFVGLAGFLRTRDGKIINDAEWRGVINTKLDMAIGVRKDYESLEDKVGNHSERITAVEASAKQLHKRMDEHISSKHNPS